MKAFFAALLIFVLVAAPVRIGHASVATLADQIQRSIDAVDWDNPMSWEVSHFGLMFTGRDTYGLWSGQSGAERIGANSTYELVGAKLCAELDGVGSSISIAEVLAYARYATQGHWWDTSRYLNDSSSGVSVDMPYLAYCHKYANEDGWDSAKWDLNSAYQEFLNCSQNSPDGFTWFYPVSGTSISWMGADRCYDENALPLAFFLNFYDQGFADALNYSEAVWSHLCADHWNSVGGFFPYRTGSFYENEVDCEVGPFWEIIGELYAKSGETLPNFTSYLQQDLAYKLLDEGWSSPLWLNYAIRNSLCASPTKERLKNTLLAFAAMHTFYGSMTSSEKQEFVNLLTGSPKAWEGLLYQSYLYSHLFNDQGKLQFKWDNNQATPTSDDATAAGIMLMFLEGIVPSSGSLAIPVSNEYYEDWCTMFPATEFRFDYNTSSIRIPVWAGTLNFIFGTEAASYTFPKDGVYDVQFSSDWNTVTRTTLVGNLSENYVHIHPSYSVAIEDVAASMTVVGQGFPLLLKVTVTNIGDSDESLSITASANTTMIGNQENVSLPKGSSTTLAFVWNTTGFDYGNYSIRAVADTPTRDDRSGGCFAVVTVPGDIDGNFQVQLADLVIFAKAYGSKTGDTNWNPTADIDGNNIVGLNDLVILASKYGQHYP